MRIIWCLKTSCRCRAVGHPTNLPFLCFLQGKRPTGMLQLLHAELIKRNGSKWYKGWTIADAVICHLDSASRLKDLFPQVPGSSAGHRPSAISTFFGNCPWLKRVTLPKVTGFQNSPHSMSGKCRSIKSSPFVPRQFRSPVYPSYLSNR